MAGSTVSPGQDAETRRLRAHIHKQFEVLRGEGGDKRGALRELFTELNYRWSPELRLPVASDGWSAAAREIISDQAPFGPAVIAEGGSGFAIIYVPIREGKTRAVPLRLTDERIIVDQLVQAGYTEALIVFSDREQRYWHFVNFRRIDLRDARRRFLLRRISVGPEDRLGTAVGRFAEIKLKDADQISALRIQDQHDAAFSVEQVTEEFFEGFKREFALIEEELRGQVDDSGWAHDFALRLLSRLMFVYFLQRKRWLGDDPQFMANYWRGYKQATGGGDDTFFDRWLRPLFFQAFQDAQAAEGIRGLAYIPEKWREVLSSAPYLNGGLFAESTLDRKYDRQFTISDRFFERLLRSPEDLTELSPGFLESYNFTISEDSPLDQEVAVDPEMIGRVYESLVNITAPGAEGGDDRQKQREAGIFYTPRTEIDLICRLALVDHLQSHIGAQHSELIYSFVFALEPQERADADEGLKQAGLWRQVEERLREVTVVDPACGSGSFLVGMMNILADLRTRADAYVGCNPTPYELSRGIIRANLYGVDVMEWACHIAELRLWLQLIVHAQLQESELRGPKPLLPNLSLKVRQGDSLVQQIEGINLAHLQSDADIPASLQSQLEELRDDKLFFYDAVDQSPDAEEQLHARERELFLEICEAKEGKLRDRIREIDARPLAPPQTSLALDEETDGPSQQHDRAERHDRQAQVREAKWAAERAQYEQQASRLAQVREAIGALEERLFIWDLAFVEIFSPRAGGFDIVVGNPPFVRQERILNPQLSSNQSAADRKRYKEQLHSTLQSAFEDFFGKTEGGRKWRQMKPDGRSDLYLYFYFHALLLLNSKGSFCFVTSNSWLDVGFGKSLQEFLARQVPIKLILDNQVKRSFSTADVNTVIVLLGAPQRETDACLGHTARFVMAQVEFEQMIDTVIISEIYDEGYAAAGRTSLPEFRLLCRSQQALLEAGAKHSEAKKQNSGRLIDIAYGGDKWGGKYLRAPDIYWEILERAGDRLVPLGDIAEVRRGIKTGANDFFYLPSRYFDIKRDGDYYQLIPKHDGLPENLRIEAEFLVPVIKSSRECKSITIDPSCLKYQLFMCHKDWDELSDMMAGEYVRWGASQGFNERPSCASRPRWWDVGQRNKPPIISPCSISTLARTFRNANVYPDGRLYEIYPSINEDTVLVATNTSLYTMFLELGSRIGLGGGLVDLTVSEVSDVLVMVDLPMAEAAPALSQLANRDVLPLREELNHPSRRNLDTVVFDALGLTAGERDAVYEAVISLVEARLKKADSV